jgi:precorrin-4/cobalt-precorrin-4 C11-methyltransferase
MSKSNNGKWVPLICFLWFLLLLPGSLAAAQGKFYIVGMGSSPDLVTLRGLETVKQTDIFILEDKPDLEAWKQWIGDKPVWYLGHISRVFYGVDPQTLKDPKKRAMAIRNAEARKEIIAKIREAVDQGKKVAALQWGDPMMYGTTFYLEMLPKDFPAEIIPGIGAFQASSAAVKMSPPYGYDTSSVILTMTDWPGRKDKNMGLMKHKTSMVFYTMKLDYPKLFEQLKENYPKDTPVAVVLYAGDREQEKVLRSTVGRFLKEIDYRNLPHEMHMLLVGKFLTVGQARKEGTTTHHTFIKQQHGDDPGGK